MSRRMLRLLPSLAAILLAAALPVTAAATFPGADGAIAFVRDGDIWTINADGTGRQQVTSGPASDSTPQWSPDGREIAFTRWGGDTAAVHVVRPGGVPRRVVGDARSPAWSPDGRRIAFVRYEPWTPDTASPTTIRTVLTDGTGERTLRYSGLAQFDPAWSPDGREIVFVQGYEEWAELWRMNADGTAARFVEGTPTQVSYGDHSRTPSWTPDGRRIAYSRNIAVPDECPNVDLDSCFNLDIAVVNRDDAGGRRLLAALGSNESEPAFSPSGGRVAFTSDITGTGQIWVMDASGNGLRQVTTAAAGGYQPDWQPLAPPRAAPAVAGLSPAFRMAGSGALDLVVSGSGFASDSVVRWNGADRPTTRLDAGRLRVAIPASDLATPGFAQVTVFTPAPGGGHAGSLAFDVRAAAPAALPAPQNAAAPRIDGSPVEGTTLSCGVGSWIGAPTSFAWQWFRGGAAIAGASGPTYVTTSLDAGIALSCRVTAANAGGVSAAVSAPVVIVSAPEPPPAVAPGTPLPGTAAAGPVAGPAPAIMRSRLRLRLAAPAIARAGTPISLRLRFSRAVAGMPVQVQRRRGSVWTTLLTRSVSGRTPLVRLTLRARGGTLLRVRYGRGASARVTGIRRVVVSVPR